MPGEVAWMRCAAAGATRISRRRRVGVHGREDVTQKISTIEPCAFIDAIAIVIARRRRFAVNLLSAFP